MKMCSDNRCVTRRAQGRGQWVIFGPSYHALLSFDRLPTQTGRAKCHKPKGKVVPCRNRIHKLNSSFEFLQFLRFHNTAGKFIPHYSWNRTSFIQFGVIFCSCRNKITCSICLSRNFSWLKDIW